ncbi:heterokaryon incompatibility protein-domain-containing protein [Cercophora newfieldiana]|uniref:Heterokaryon incompatibility protein-domain-containing protein n=1 Tax=Cercophora newfieldiana TaxID=92897 RepID=A0AA39YBH0_9PEZI|nr:heterokaryon incompatibility protein-domain-containing protein [Cercophora newfieldiana]
MWTILSLISGILAIFLLSVVVPLVRQPIQQLVGQDDHVQEHDDSRYEQATEEFGKIVDKIVRYYQKFKTSPTSVEEPYTPLEQLNASSASLIYWSLNPDEIRLIQLQPGYPGEPLICSAFNVRRSSAPSYTALSYVWGSQANPGWLHLNNEPMFITQNLRSCLHQLRSRDEPVTLWIDALAINQTDTQERNQQVSIMRDIYSGAAKTIVCLDPSNNEVVTLILDLFSLFHSNPNLVSRLSLSAWLYRAITTVGGLSYWQRVWVTQEVMYSRDVTLVHQSHSMPYTAFTTVWTRLAAHLKSLAPDAETQQDTLRLVELSSFMTTFGPSVLPSPSSALAESYIPLDTWIKTIQHKKATNPCDIVFGHYGCFPPEVRRKIEIDYSAPPALVWAGMAQLVAEQTRSLDVILPEHCYARTMPDLPSWTPQWCADPKTPLSAGSGFKYARRPYAAGGKWREGGCEFIEGGRVLSVEGLEVGRVDVVASPGFKPTKVADRSEMFAWLRDIQGEEVDAYFSRLCRVFGLQAESLGNPRVASFVDAFAAGDETDEWNVEEGFAGRGNLIPDRRRAMTIMVHHFGRAMCSYQVSGLSGESHVGYCLGSDQIIPGDRVCVLFGCSVPVVLREEGQYFALLGDVYVPGWMMGEAVQRFDTGDGRKATFLII